jgi:uncharacterized membrane protein
VILETEGSFSVVHRTEGGDVRALQNLSGYHRSEHAVYYLGDLLGRLGQRAFPSNARTAPGRGIQIILSRPDWEDFVAQSFDQIRDSARNDPHVIDVLLDVLRRLERTVPAERAPALRAQRALAMAERGSAR